VLNVHCVTLRNQGTRNTMREFLRKVLGVRSQGHQRNSARSVVRREKAGESDYSKYLIRARKLELLGKPVDAMRLLELAAEVPHGELEVFRKLASLQIENGMKDEARDTYLAILQIDITDLDALESFLELN